jgi:hypothetical protein
MRVDHSPLPLIFWNHGITEDRDAKIKLAIDLSGHGGLG